MGDTLASRFELGDRRGIGGMGSVYRARDLATGATVALKLLRDERLEEVDRFAHEAELLASLDHDAIVRYVAHGRTTDGCYLAMEWLDGEDLDERLARAPMTPADAASMLARIAEALGVAHARGVIHRDVKPSNIFLPGGDPTRAKLLDFGVARSHFATRPETQTGTALGTPGYMAPEQARGDRDLDARVDVFALGAVLFRCLVGTAPFDAANTIAVLTRVLFEEPPPLWALRPDLPAAVHELVGRALSKDRAPRPADGGALARALRDVLPELALAEAPTGARGITGGEERILAAVLVRRPQQAPAATGGGEASGGASTPTVVLANDADAVVAMRQAQALRGAFERLADGTWATVFAGDGATEMASRAARFALFVRDRFAGAHVAVATGRRRAGTSPTTGAFDRAAGLVTRAPPGAVVLDDATATLIGGRFHVDRGEPGALLRGEVGTGVHPLPIAVSPFVGRAKELRVLRGVYDGVVEDGAPAVALVLGSPGAGKSRLVAELLGQLERDGATVWRGQGDPLAASAPFAPVAQLLRRALGLTDQSMAPRREAIEQRVREVVAGEAVARIVTAVGELLDPTGGDDVVDPVARGDQIRRAVEDWIAAEAARGPLVIVLDDVHWADPGTLALCDGVLRNVAGPVFVLAMARPEVHERFPRLWAERGLTALELSPLPAAAAQQLARAVAGPDASDGLIAELVERSGGNPFFLEELARARDERDAGEWPDTVLATVEARLARLDGDARRLLRAAAVIGPVFWPGAVIQLVGGAAFGAAVSARLDALIEREFIVPSPGSRFPGERQLAFRHALIRDAAYGTLPDDDRRLAHRLAAAWLERVGEAPAVIAQHFERGAAPAEAVPHYVRAAEAALIGDDVVGALALCGRGVAAGATGADRGALRWLEAEAGWWRGEHARAVAAGAEALQLLPARTLRWYAALGATARAAGALGSPTDLMLLAGELTRQPPPAEERSVAVTAAVKLAHSILFAGEARQLRKLRSFVQSHSAELPADDPAWGWVEYLRYLAAVRDGELGRATRAVEKSIAAYAAAGDLRNACLQRMHLGALLLQIGQLEAAHAALTTSLAAAERLGAAYTAAHARHHLGLALVRLGRADEAEAMLADCRRTFHEQGDQRAEAAVCGHLAEAWAARPADAEAVLRAGLTLVEALPPMRAALAAQLARVLVARGEAAAACALVQPAHDLVEAGGIVEEHEVLIRLAHADALDGAGYHQQASGVAWVALQRLRTLAARLGDPAWQDSFVHRVPVHAAILALAARLGVSAD
ncbi:MAG TPA: protein kinase [Kofleriaceae bacterium]|nr:protein kinase [Kofleriaceae bacterium]